MLAPDKIRNVAVVGHRGAGKTSLTEALLFEAGEITRLGSVAEGTTVADFGTVLSPLDLAVGQGGDVDLVYVSGRSNSLSILTAITHEAVPKPTLTALAGPHDAVAARAVRLRIGLSSPGRALVTISPAGRRRVVGAFVATVPAAGRTIGLPARVRAALAPGRYTVTMDTGGSPLAAARRTVPLRVAGA